MVAIQTRPVTSPPATRPAPWLGFALAALAAGAAAVALLGPLALGVIDYRASEGATNQVIGGDIAGLLLVAPVSILSAVLVFRGAVLGPVLALGPALYGLYMYSQLALGNDLSRYPGNSERFFALYLVLFVLAGGIAVVAWNRMERGRLPAVSRRVERTVAVFLLVVSGFLAVGLHLPGLLDAWSGRPTSPEYLADPVVFWLVKFMDLGMVVPAITAIAVGALRRRSWATAAMYPAASWAALLGTSVAGMAVVMQVRGDPGANAANLVAFVGFAALALWLAWVLHRPMAGRRSRIGDG